MGTINIGIVIIFFYRILLYLYGKKIVYNINTSGIIPVHKLFTNFLLTFYTVIFNNIIYHYCILHFNKHNLCENVKLLFNFHNSQMKNVKLLVISFITYTFIIF